MGGPLRASMNTSEGKIDDAVHQLLYKLETHIKTDVQLNTRAKEAQRALINTAAELLHKSWTRIHSGDCLTDCGKGDPRSPYLQP